MLALTFPPKVYLRLRALLPAVSAVLALAALACGQDLSLAPRLPSCDLLAAQTMSNPGAKARACYYGLRVIAPTGAFKASFATAFAQLRDSPRLNDDGFAAVGYRIGAFYARRAGQNAGEFLAGYLHHEPLRPAPSGETGFWLRTKYAVRSVLIAQNANGYERLAWAPLAGAFGSGLVSIACYRDHNSVPDGFRRTGFAYGGYFGTALMREFHPEFSRLANRILHRENGN